MHWPSFWWGAAAVAAGLPAATALMWVLAMLFLPGPDRGMKFHACEWRFAGLADNYGVLGRVPRAHLSRPIGIHAFASRVWHDLVIRRTKKHRAAWTARYESLAEGSSLRAHERQWAKRNGTKGHEHQ
ncbi:hypothetical protein ACXR2T_07665 [Leucobacter sp. HY1910]